MALTRRGDGSRVRAGDMRDQVKIQQFTQADDGQGGRVGTSSDVVTTWANLIPLSAARALAYGIPMTNKPYDIDMRWEEADYTLDEDTVLEVVTTGQKLYIHSVIDVDLRGDRAKIVAVEKK